MRNLDKYKGVIPAFYACYDKDGNISPEAVQALTKYFVEKGVKGVYVNGSSGECIYQSVEDRKIVLENVMKAAEGKLTVIAHVACNNTKDSQELAKHADWVEEFLPKYGFTAGSGLEGEITPERLHEIVQTEIGLVFKEVLTDAGVYKCTEEGRAAFMRFVDTVNA